MASQKSVEPLCTGNAQDEFDGNHSDLLPSQHNDSEALLTVEEAAHALRIDDDTVRSWLPPARSLRPFTPKATSRGLTSSAGLNFNNYHRLAARFAAERRQFVGVDWIKLKSKRLRAKGWETNLPAVARFPTSLVLEVHPPTFHRMRPIPHNLRSQAL